MCVCGISVPTLHCERKKVPGINSRISLWKSLPIVSIVFQKNACPTALSGPECEDYQVECQNFEGHSLGI